MRTVWDRDNSTRERELCCSPRRRPFTRAGLASERETFHYRPESLAILQWNEQQKGHPYGLVRTGCAFWIQVPHLDRLPIRLQKKTAWWNRWQCTAFPRILVHFIKKVNKDIERSYGCKNYWESFNTCFCAGRHFLTFILPWIKIYSLFLLNIERIYQGKRMRLILRESR